MNDLKYIAMILTFLAAQSFGTANVKAITVYGASSTLPSGYLNTHGSQIVDGTGRSVRIACVGGMGTVVVGGRLGYMNTPAELDSTLHNIRAAGFNCLRVDFNDKNVNEPSVMSQFDQLVASCKLHKVKVIFDNHNDEATPANWQNAAQQSNGLWFDSGPGTDGTDGAGDKGTVTDKIFQQDWVKMAKHWSGNDTVVGFDIRNEPCAHTSTPALWGGNGPTDIHAMYERVGNAVLKANPHALIICESVINYRTGFYEGDLSVVKTDPIILSNPAKLVYSIHEYPKEIGGYSGPEFGPGYISRMNKSWGWLVKDGIAPVWVGEMGSSMKTAAEKAWGTTLLDYMDGHAPDGPRFSPKQQPISGDWWCWGHRPGELPDGCLGKDGTLRPEQLPFINALQYVSRVPGHHQLGAEHIR